MSTTVAAIEHDDNGPFVRAARAGIASGQTETVHAVAVSYLSGEVEYWNARAKPFTDDEVRDIRMRAYRFKRSGRVLDVWPTSREVTISATEWASAE